MVSKVNETETADMKTEALKEIMAEYNKARSIWEREKGSEFNEEEFHAWFTAQVIDK